MENNKTKNLIWLADTINRNGKITFADINSKWLAGDKERRKIPLRTFHNHRRDIEDLFDINIECDKSTNTYFVADAEGMLNSQLKMWLLNSFSLNNILQESIDLKRRVIFEDIPSGLQFIDPITDAMRRGLQIAVKYQTYYWPEPRDLNIEPYFLRLFHQRWYLMGVNADVTEKNADTTGKKTDLSESNTNNAEKSSDIPEKNADNSEKNTVSTKKILGKKIPGKPEVQPEVRSYALDRMLSVKISDTKFKYPRDFNPKEFYKDCFGIIKDQEADAKRTLIKATAFQSNYLRNLPLHESQQETERGEEFSLFELRICPTYDLCQQLLSLGSAIEVLEPPVLREMVKEQVEKMGEIY